MSSPSSSAFRTPEQKPRRKNRSPAGPSPGLIPFDSKRIYLIRHGQSQGQVASKHARRVDTKLTDCGLTLTGIDQATRIPESLGEAYQRIELIVSSPLTRALQTAVTGFAGKPVMVHYDLREVGSTTIPENVPRKMKDVLADLGCHVDMTIVDVDTFRPDQWPRHHDTPPKVIRRDHIRRVFQWIGSRPEKCVAVVCHYHVIRAALQDPWDCSGPNIHPENGVPIACELSVVAGRIRLEIVADEEQATATAAMNL